MAQQLQLNIREQLAYGPDNFFIHAGYKSICDSVLSLVTQAGFGIAYIYGTRRSGKTHFSIYLMNQYGKAGLFPRLVDGQRFEDFLKQLEVGSQKLPDVFVIDDIDQYLREIEPGASGSFVNFIEKLRLAQRKVVLLSGRRLSDLPCDDHVLSRILAGFCFEIEHPAEADMPQVVGAMARQRGIKLSEKKLNFLCKRLPRQTEAIEAYLDRVHHLSRLLGKKVQFPVLNDAL